MTQSERRKFLIDYLLNENPGYSDIHIPPDEEREKRLLRALMNIREAKPVSSAFLSVQDEYLQQAIKEKGITDISSMKPARGNLYIWQGDITTLGCDAIVNAANSGMTGCYVPCHSCIDNAIHTYAGIQLRLECADIMRKQGHGAETGSAWITSGYNLPARFVIHTVGPIVRMWLTEEDEDLLALCYRSCLAAAEENGLCSIAFCCISTGEFHFPPERAAEIAVDTVCDFLSHGSEMKVVFNVFKDSDMEIYRYLIR